jgi:hypothetical protein
MKNLDIKIKDNVLIIKVNLAESHGKSKRGVSEIIASSGGNLRLFDESGFRSEILNMTVSKRKADADWSRRLRY